MKHLSQDLIDEMKASWERIMACPAHEMKFLASEGNREVSMCFKCGHVRRVDPKTMLFEETARVYNQTETDAFLGSLGARLEQSILQAPELEASALEDSLRQYLDAAGTKRCRSIFPRNDKKPTA